MQAAKDDSMWSAGAKVLSQAFDRVRHLGDTAKQVNKDSGDGSWNGGLPARTEPSASAKAQAAAAKANATPQATPQATPAPKPPAGPSAAHPNSYKHGGVVQKTGLALVHKGEEVKPIYDAAHDGMAGGDSKPPKVLSEIRTRKGHSGGYIHEHHHKHPEHHPMEEHTSADQDAMVNHMMEHMGSPNPGEAEADAGQSGIAPMPTGGSPTGGADAQASALGM